jgi:NNP family nitrate/nitrite transporter-like MFS transporter
VIGGLGGFICPILFGYLLRETGVWSSAWFFLFVLTTVSLVWMHSVIRSLEKRKLRSIEAMSDPEREPSRARLPDPEISAS